MVKKLTSSEVHDTVRRKYGEICCSIQDRFKYPTGREGIVLLGYDLTVVNSIPADVVKSFCGVGNLFSLGRIEPGNVVLDVGCGAGFDLIFAGKSTGTKGRMAGIDLVPKMIEKARQNVLDSGLDNCNFKIAGSESIPFDDNEFDTVISNGSLYLSPLKEKTFLDIHRVLKPGGSFRFADVVLKDNLPDDVMSFFDGWSG